MSWSPDRALQARMALALVLLVGVVGLLVVALAHLLSAILTLAALVVPVPPGVRPAVGYGGATIVVLAVAVREYRTENPTGVRGFDARALDPADHDDWSAPVGNAGPVDRTGPDEEADLSATVARLAHQVGLPAPEVAVADLDAPNAFTTGLTADGATVVVTRGLLDRLDAPEVTAVLAHEVAHLRNRDAAVMTLASVPLAVAESLRTTADDWWAALAAGGRNYVAGMTVGLVVVAGYAVATLCWVAGRLAVRALGRYREVAADRGAVALTGSAAALASALRTVEAADPPARDLRAVDGATAALGIVAVERGPGPVRLGPEGDRLPLTYRLTAPVRPLLRRYLGTHPPLQRRLERLRAMA